LRGRPYTTRQAVFPYLPFARHAIFSYISGNRSPLFTPDKKNGIALP
jgi:hypothetical protein